MSENKKSKLISHLPRSEKQDALFFKDYAKAIYETLEELTSEHIGLTIGIFGSWGSGKSSVLRMIDEVYQEARPKKVWLYRWMMFDAPSKKPPIVVFFEAWEYAKEEVWIALLRTIRECIRKNLSLPRLFIVTFFGWKSRIKLKELILSLVTRIIFPFIVFTVVFVSLSVLFPSVNAFIGMIVKFLGLLSLGTQNQAPFINQLLTISQLVIAMFTLFGIAWAGIRFLLSVFSEGFRKKLDKGDVYSIELFRNEMRDLISTVGCKQRIIVLIDDLDRAPLDQIVPMLEAMKHFGSGLELQSLEMQHIVHAPISFLLAADRVSLQRAISRHYKDFWYGKGTQDEIERFAREYLEKIVQIYFELPPLPAIFSQRLLDADILQPLVLNWDPASQLYLQDDIELAISKSKNIFIYASKDNPREVIQAHNTFIVLWNIVRKRFMDTPYLISPPLLSALILIHYIWPEVFEQINAYPELFFYICALASNKQNTVCSSIELEEILSIGLPNGVIASYLEDIRSDKYDLIRLIGVVISSESIESLHSVFKMGVDNMYRYLSMHPYADAPKGDHLCDIAAAFMSGDPVIIRFADRVGGGERIKREKERLREHLNISYYTSQSLNKHTISDTDLSFENKLILALFAIGRIGDADDITIIKHIVEARKKYSHKIVERAVFALFQLMSKTDKYLDSPSHILADLVLDIESDIGMRVRIVHLLSLINLKSVDKYVRHIITYTALHGDDPLLCEKATKIVWKEMWFDDILEVMQLAPLTFDIISTFRGMLFMQNQKDMVKVIPKNISDYLIDLVLTSEPSIRQQALTILLDVQNIEQVISYLEIIAESAIKLQKYDVFDLAFSKIGNIYRTSKDVKWRGSFWQKIWQDIEKAERGATYQECFFEVLQNIYLPEVVELLGGKLASDNPTTRDQAHKALERIASGAPDERVAAMAEKLLQNS